MGITVEIQVSHTSQTDVGHVPNVHCFVALLTPGGMGDSHIAGEDWMGQKRQR